MWKYAITAAILFLFQNSICEERDVTSLLSVEAEGTASLSTREEKINLKDIVKCGMDLSEPLKINHTVGGLGIEYTLDNIVVSNISKCAVKSLKMDLDSLNVSMYFNCPYLSIFAKYNIRGMLMAIFLDGQGESRVFAENFGISINGTLEVFIGEDGEKHLKVKTFTPKPYYGGPVVHNLTNLFNGNEYLATEAHKYLNSNWKAVSEFGHVPFMTAVLKPFLRNVNKCFKPVPVQNIQI